MSYSEYSALDECRSSHSRDRRIGQRRTPAHGSSTAASTLQVCQSRSGKQWTPHFLWSAGVPCLANTSSKLEPSSCLYKVTSQSPSSSRVILVYGTPSYFEALLMGLLTLRHVPAVFKGTRWTRQMTRREKRRDIDRPRWRIMPRNETRPPLLTLSWEEWRPFPPRQAQAETYKSRAFCLPAYPVSSWRTRGEDRQDMNFTYGLAVTHKTVRVVFPLSLCRFRRTK